MAQFILTAVGSYFGGPVGAFAGSLVGGAIDRRLFGQRGRGPRPGDLGAPKVTYGSELPRLAGTNITAGYVAWQSRKRAQEETVDAKGSSEQTVGYTYTMDVEIILGVHDQEAVWKGIAITRVWVNGDLRYSARTGIDSGTVQANGAPPWDALEFCDGGPSQAPWAAREAEVGVGFAPANRGRNSVRITGLQLGGSTVLPSLKFEIITAGTSAAGPEIVLAHFDGSAGASVFANEVGADGSGTDVELSAAAAQFGATGAATTDNSGSLINWPVAAEITESTPVTMEGWFEFSQDPNSTFNLMTLRTATGITAGVSWLNSVSPDEVAWEFRFAGEVTTGAYVPIEDSLVHPIGERFHLRFTFDPATNALVLALNGTEILSATYSGAAFTQSVIDAEALEGAGAFSGVAGCDEIRYTLELHPASGFDVPTSPFSTATTWTPGTVTLGDIVAAESRRCGIPAALIDTSLIDATAVRGYPSAGGARAALEQLCRMFHVDLVQDSALRFVPRGGASEATLAYADLGAGFDRAAEEPLEHTVGSDEEIPRKLAFTCISTEADGDPDTKIGDRGTGSMRRVPTEESALLLTPAEQQDLADTLVAALRTGGTTFKCAVSEALARHQPTSVVVLTDADGFAYRARITAEDWTLGVHQWELALDDASIYTQAGIASSDREPTIDIPAPPVARLYVLDIPLLRPEDDGAGEYVAVTSTGRFRGVTIHKSSDHDVTYVPVAEIASRATAGECDSALPAYTGWGWDNASVLTVTLDDGSGGTLSSATKAAIEGNRYLNLAAVGVHGRWELLQFATATLVTGSTYELRGLLRNLFGTEWASGDHAVGDEFVLLQRAGMARVAGAVSDLGQTRYYKAVPAGRAVSSVAAVSIVCGEQALLPYAPVDVRNDAGTIRGNRRSRLEGAVGIDPPLGEVSERYDAELYDGVTLEDSVSGLTSASWTPGTDPSGLTVRVYQLSDLVGRGHVAEKAIP